MGKMVSLLLCFLENQSQMHNELILNTNTSVRFIFLCFFIYIDLGNHVIVRDVFVCVCLYVTVCAGAFLCVCVREALNRKQLQHAIPHMYSA